MRQHLRVVNRPTAQYDSIDSCDVQEAEALGFMPRVLTLTTLPHSRPASNTFERVNGHHRLRLTARRPIGLPYGVYPRLILVYLTTAAVRSRSPIVELGPSPNEFARRLGLTPISGKRGTVPRLQDQLERLLTTRLSWYRSDGVRADESCSAQIGSKRLGCALLGRRTVRRQARWRSGVVLSTNFFEEVTCSSVPVDLRSIRRLSTSPLSIDLYVWLTHRMSYLRRPALIPWDALRSQFGSDYGRIRGEGQETLSAQSYGSSPHPLTRLPGCPR